MLGIGSVRERIRESLWFWPLISIALSSGLGAVLTTTRPLADSGPFGVLVDLDVSQVHAITATLVGAMITAASIISSLTIVALQTASTQYSPRLLRNFVRDTTTQVTFATFLGTAAYLIAVFVCVGDESPQLALTLAMAALLASLVAVAIFFNHVSQSIRIETIIRQVATETLEAADRLAEWLGGADTSFEAFDPSPDSAVAIEADRSGYVQQIDVGALAQISARRGVDIWIAPQLGQWIMEGTTIAWCAPSGHAHDDDAASFATTVASAAGSICDQVEIGYERTMHHDVALGIRQLVDIANKAMSPAVNDPYTAMQSIDHLGPILAGLGRGPVGDHIVTGPDGHGWVAVPGASLMDFAALATDQIRRVGAREPAVALRLLDMIGDVVQVVDVEYHDGLCDLARRVLDDARRRTANPDDLSEVEATAAVVVAAHDAVRHRARRNGL
ncbi:MAG: DUF2254 domain-containing protein [Ilumatobacteraceae bacterium]